MNFSQLTPAWETVSLSRAWSKGHTRGDGIEIDFNRAEQARSFGTCFRRWHEN